MKINTLKLNNHGGTFDIAWFESERSHLLFRELRGKPVHRQMGFYTLDKPKLLRYLREFQNAYLSRKTHEINVGCQLVPTDNITLRCVRSSRFISVRITQMCAQRGFYTEMFDVKAEWLDMLIHHIGHGGANGNSKS